MREETVSIANASDKTIREQVECEHLPCITELCGDMLLLDCFVYSCQPAAVMVQCTWVLARTQ